MVMLEDVISPKGSLVENLLELSKGDKYDIYRSKPDNCCKCGSKEVIGVEIMGSYEGILSGNAMNAKMLCLDLIQM